ncbi:FKBP-type peptidyl-prolyl cis-trans isomerase [Psychrosphaera sp. B3R10]|uniref:FKBP-type peptidyl-prolyl cis-trans isomerase n=1 Tax=unclassified Psychrosphaera TaxID=2641570 RepID=UPI001C082605|nr:MULTISPECIES: FKBP-type peptidyl-prolyl cis-trans isomerase [unclassified Psychrosphaera]MBU2883697.1 FKBP-type peptidyl-prolyl cis-trans isomerase [Psychrosphaera sp. I2R16]MBU2988001.1 FKBP-type peptidyl-prolyl cis-trans isomerase [Psychrosphaera sp. B3R10]
MKKALKLSLIAASIGLMSACGSAEQANTPAKLDSDADKQSYALGASMGTYLKKNLDSNAEIGISLKQELIIAGIQDALVAKSQLSDEEIQTVMQALQQQVSELKTKEAREAGLTFLAENAKREGVVVTDSGLQYEVLVAAEGAKPAATDTVEVHYHGTLLDGTVFDSSVDRGEKISFPLNRVIPGWTEGLQYMSIGSKYKFFIPSELAYGSRNAGQIPPNSTLIFEVELFDIKKEG